MTRDEVIAALKYIISEGCCETQCDYMNEIEEAITLLKSEQKRGRWIEESDRERHWQCSVCGYTVGMAAKTFKYCPECGVRAKMEADDEHTKPDRDA